MWSNGEGWVLKHDSHRSYSQLQDIKINTTVTYVEQKYIKKKDFTILFSNNSTEEYVRIIFSELWEKWIQKVHTLLSYYKMVEK